MKKDFDNLLQKQMDRRDFLKHVGIGFVAITGVSTLVKTLTSVNGPKHQAAGYGGSVYGGNSVASNKQ